MMKRDIQGRLSVDFRTHPSKKIVNAVRKTTSSQSNTRKGSKNTKRNPNTHQTSKKSRASTDPHCLCNSTHLSELVRTVVKL